MTWGAEVAAGLVAARVAIAARGRRRRRRRRRGRSPSTRTRDADRARARVRARARTHLRRRARRFALVSIGRRAFEPLGRIRGERPRRRQPRDGTEGTKQKEGHLPRSSGGPLRSGFRSRRDAIRRTARGRVPAGSPRLGGFGGAGGTYGGGYPTRGAGYPDARGRLLRRPGVRARQRRRPRRRCDRWVRRWRRDGCRRRCLGRGCVPRVGWRGERTRGCANRDRAEPPARRRTIVRTTPPPRARTRTSIRTPTGRIEETTPRCRRSSGGCVGSGLAGDGDARSRAPSPSATLW